MAAASETYSSSASDGGLIALLGQELYKDYFSTGEDGGIVVGGASDTDKSQACALESIVDNCLLHGSLQSLRRAGRMSSSKVTL